MCQKAVPERAEAKGRDIKQLHGDFKAHIIRFLDNGDKLGTPFSGLSTLASNCSPVLVTTHTDRQLLVPGAIEESRGYPKQIQLRVERKTRSQVVVPLSLPSPYLVRLDEASLLACAGSSSSTLDV